MKKTIVHLLFFCLLSATPAFAAIYTYSGSGYVLLDPQAPTELQATMEIDDRLFTDIYNGTWEPLQVAPGEPLPAGFSIFDDYRFLIYNWTIDMNGTSYTGTEGVIKPWDVVWSLGNDEWLGLQTIFSADQQVAGTLPLNLSFLVSDCPITPLVNGEINLSRVPEPSTFLLVLTALIGFAWFMARKRDKDLLPADSN